MTNTQEVRSLTPHFPEYRLARHFLRILNGGPYTLYREMHNQIMEQRGTPQSQVDWSNPDEWIPERLHGDEQSLAQRIWLESDHELNPRYLTGCWRLATRHAVLEEDGQGVLRITERGRQFLEQPEGNTVAEIDAFEGVLTILRLAAERGPGQRGDLLPEYTEFCHTFTRYRSDSVVKGSLYDRLVNLVGREYLESDDSKLAQFEPTEEDEGAEL